MSAELHTAIENVDFLSESHQNTDENKNKKHPEEEISETVSEFDIDIETVLDDDDNDDPLFCKLCNVKVTSAKILQRHLDGRKHRMKSEKEGKTYVCDLCNIVANSEIQLNIHVNGAKHRHRLIKKKSGFAEAQPNCNGVGLIIVCAICIFVNLLLLFKSCEN